MQEEKIVRSSKSNVIIPYGVKLTVTAICFVFTAFVLLIIALAAKVMILALPAFALLFSGAFFMIRNKKVVLVGKEIKVIYFLGIIKERTFTPVECGFFISEKSSKLQNPLYTDKRTLHGNIPEDVSKYIYLSEYVLSKQEQEGSQYIYGEPILILNYTRKTYEALCDVFTFNCEGF